MNKTAFLRGYLMEKLAKPSNLLRAYALAHKDLKKMNYLLQHLPGAGAESAAGISQLNALGVRAMPSETLRRLRFLAQSPVRVRTNFTRFKYTRADRLRQILKENPDTDMDALMDAVFDLSEGVGGHINKAVALKLQGLRKWVESKGGFKKVLNDPKLSKFYDEAQNRILNAETDIMKEIKRTANRTLLKDPAVDNFDTAYEKLEKVIPKDTVFDPENRANIAGELRRRATNSVSGPIQSNVNKMPKLKPGEKWVDLSNKKYSDLTPEDADKLLTDAYGKGAAPDFVYKGVSGAIDNSGHLADPRQMRAAANEALRNSLFSSDFKGASGFPSVFKKNLKPYLSDSSVYKARAEKDIFHSPIPNVAQHYTSGGLVVRTDLKGGGLKDKQVYTKHEMLVDPDARKRAVEAYKKEGKKSARAKRNIDESPYYETVIEGKQPLKHQELGQVVQAEDGHYYMRGLVDENGKPFTADKLQRQDRVFRKMRGDIAHVTEKKKDELLRARRAIKSLQSRPDYQPVYQDIPLRVSRDSKYSLDDYLANRHTQEVYDEAIGPELGRYLDAVAAGNKHPHSALKKFVPENIRDFNRVFLMNPDASESEIISAFLKAHLSKFPADARGPLKESMIRGAMARVFTKVKSGKMSHAEAMEELKKIKALRRV